VCSERYEEALLAAEEHVRSLRHHKLRDVGAGAAL
jgi:hypothetical protein